MFLKIGVLKISSTLQLVKNETLAKALKGSKLTIFSLLLWDAFIKSIIIVPLLYIFSTRLRN